MFLQSLEVRNFRGIAAGRLDLDETTVLIGENDCGRTSLISALDVALSSTADGKPVLRAHHFHRPENAAAAAPLAITLTFVERAAGEWREADLGALAAITGKPGPAARRLVLEIATEPRRDGAEFVAHWRIGAPGGASLEDDVEALARLRELNPLVWLRSGVLMAATPAERVPANGDAAAGGGIAALVAEIESRHAALVSGTAANELGELKAGYAAARELLAQRTEWQHTPGSMTHAPLVDVLGGRAGAQEGFALPRRGSAARQIGVLILTAAVIRQGVGHWARGGQPLLVVEDPEAHLHPMTLASVWGLLDHAETQKIVGTHSDVLLAAAPFESIRRLTRHDGQLSQWRVHADRLSKDERRKLGYHVRSRRGEAMFARCWLLVEGETEFWMLPELARLAGHDFNLEGIAVVEFAQCGLPPLIKLARELGIAWHVLADGDRTGRYYASEAQAFLGNEAAALRITQIRELDLEHCLWQHGYAGVYQRVAGIHVSPEHRVPPRRVIARAVKRHSKPYLAFEVLAAASEAGSPGVPPVIRRLVDTCVALAREAPARAAPGQRPPRPRHRGRRGSPGRR